MRDEYLRRAEWMRTLDGDTFEFRMDLGFDVDTRQEIRLRGFSAKELSEAEGPAMREYADALLRRARVIMVQTFKTNPEEHVFANLKRTFTRYVGDVWVDGMSLADALSMQLLTLRKTRDNESNRIP